MTDIERRIKTLEDKAGVNKEVTIVLIRNYAKGNTACKGYEDDKSCPPFNRLKQSPGGMNEFGVSVFSFPCKDCKERI